MIGTIIWHPIVRPDERGHFVELWKSGEGDKKFGQIEQINMSVSKKGVLRGLHLQHTEPMGKVMTVTSGRAFIAAVNCNPNSEDFKKIVTCEISPEKPAMFYADASWARGFLALEDNTAVVYACTGRYSGGGELAINPMSAGVVWPHMDEYIISEKDETAKTFQQHWLNDWYKDVINWDSVR